MSWSISSATIAKLKKGNALDLTSFEEAITKMAERLKMHPRVVAVILDTAIKSDHEGIQKQLEDLLVITKMTHPEPAFKESQAIEAERLAAIEEEKAREDARRYQQTLHRREQEKEKTLVSRIQTIREQNLKNAQKVVDDLKAKLVGGLNYDKLTYQEQSLAGEITHMSGDYLERGGFLWFKITWVGGDIQLHDNHKLYKWLKRNRFELFADEPKLERINNGFYSGYGYSLADMFNQYEGN